VKKPVQPIGAAGTHANVDMQVGSEQSRAAQGGVVVVVPPVPLVDPIAPEPELFDVDIVPLEPWPAEPPVLGKS
jgi:hypothetical protein